MLFTETIDIYCDIRTKNVNIPCEQNAEYPLQQVGHVATTALWTVK